MKQEKKPKEINREEKPTRNIGHKKKMYAEKNATSDLLEMSSRNKMLQLP